MNCLENIIVMSKTPFKAQGFQQRMQNLLFYIYKSSLQLLSIDMECDYLIPKTN